ncbi:MAG: ADP-glyceromanno-heptose 6-epimerase, partial [Bacteroidetes bacterium]|nr:ADP-glyceromanno-heptose 6-epimerase [Bacteroidota bacterium]
MIIVTGAAGFIGSCLVRRLNHEGFENILLVDDFNSNEKNENLHNQKYRERVDRERFIDLINNKTLAVDFIFHIGARTDTTEFDESVLDKLNLSYSKTLWNYCSDNDIPLIYASSAATYGLGEHGYSDDHDRISLLQPLNPYGWSKQNFDLWVLQQEKTPPFWAGLKFFNVYGPNEYHKGSMQSLVSKTFPVASAGEPVTLFRSHDPKYPDGGQMRDFVYVQDCVAVMLWMLDHADTSGLFNLGTGQARTFLDFIGSMFAALEMEPALNWIDTPDEIRDRYQYFTQAEMGRLRAAGYHTDF